MGLCKLSREASTTALEPTAMVLRLPRTRLLLSEEETVIFWSGERAEGAWIEPNTTILSDLCCPPDDPGFY